MKILVAQNVPRSRTGGMSRMMGFIHDELVADGHEVDYVGSEDLGSLPGGRWARFSFPALVLHRAVQEARAGRPYDLINVHEPVAAAIALGKALAGNPRVVVTTHGVEKRAWELALEELRLGRSGPSSWSRLVYPPTNLWQSSVALRFADHIFCLNEEDKNYLQAEFAVRASDITRIFPAAAAAFFEQGDRGCEFALTGRLLFAGTWRKNKGIEDLDPAFVTLAGAHPELQLVVLGAGMPESVILADFPEHVRSRVVVKKAGSDAEFAATYASCDMLLQPSLFEGTPQTIMEAMACGRPIVTTRTCGMRDVIRDHDNGLLIPMRSPASLVQAVEELLRDAALRERLGAAARSDARENYVWKTVAQPVKRAYAELMEFAPEKAREVGA